MDHPVRIRVATASNRNSLAMSTDGTRIFEAPFLAGTVEERAFPSQTLITTHTVPLVEVIAVRGSTLWWVEKGTDWDIYENGSGLVASIPDDGQTGISFNYNSVDDRFYVFNFASTSGHGLLRVHPTTGAVVEVMDMSGDDPSPQPLQTGVTPDGCVWGYSWDAGASRTIWYRWDPTANSGTHNLFSGSEPWPYDEPSPPIPRPDNTVWFVAQDDILGYRLEPDGTITPEPTLDYFTDIDFNEYTFDGITSLAQTPDCNTIVFISDGWWWSLAETPGGLRVGMLRMRPT